MAMIFARTQILPLELDNPMSRLRDKESLFWNFVFGGNEKPAETSATQPPIYQPLVLLRRHPIVLMRMNRGLRRCQVSSMRTRLRMHGLRQPGSSNGKLLYPPEYIMQPGSVFVAIYIKKPTRRTCVRTLIESISRLLKR